jgi:hypothetical protein
VPGARVPDDSDAAIMTFSSMFPLKYYGTSRSLISVNSNGFVTMGYSDYLYGDNSPIPDAHGPVRMIAPLWDDLAPSAGGDIYRWLDTRLLGLRCQTTPVLLEYST